MIYILRGLPRSGKTTFAKQIVEFGNGRIKRVAKEDLRPMLDNDHRFGKSEASMVSGLRDVVIDFLISSGYDVIVDETFAEYKELEALMKTFKYSEFQLLDRCLSVTFEECVRRDAARERTLGVDLLRDYEAAFAAQGIVIPHET